VRIMASLVSRTYRRLSRELAEERWQRERLENIARAQQLRIDELAAHIERLSARLCATEGRVKGGGKGRPAGSQQQLFAAGELSREELRQLPKEELRAYLQRHPPTKEA
jgi:hypothetical protein